ncbi:hypothetical protein CRI93_04775 [Longimonas halophila]|uniref:Uncharacterized protein n=1 Tax=Longimonas halophila TaxID=1469170 RepID=A0A2H3NNM6_9BACT|nr:hypothetical protein CRI93_04775 [Longimonas halophila]
MLVLALFIGLTGCDPSVSPMEDTNPPSERPDASSSALSVALLPGGMQQASSETGPAYRCTANVFDPEAEAGYRTYDLALAFPDSVQADSSSEVESEFTEFNFTLSLEPTADSTAADSTARQTASRVRCNVPPTEEALALMADRIEADLQAQFGEDGYRFVDSDSSAAGQAQSSAQRAAQNGGYDGAAFRSNYVQDVPDYLTCFDGGGGAMVCFFNEVTVTADGGGGYTPTIPTPPDPGAPSGPGDDGTPSGGGSPSDPADCSGSLQGPTPESTAAYPASGDVPTWLIPQPDADPASGSDLLDPDYPDNPTPADPGGAGDPGGTECDDEETSEDEPEEEPGWGKAIKIGRKIKDAIDRGDDLLDVQTWKRIGQEEWDDLLECGLNTMDATTGDPVAIVSALDCAADQLLGVSFFELLSGLKIADRLGLGWYDDVMGAMADSGYVNQLINNTSDLNLLEDIATQGDKLFGKWVMPEGTSTMDILHSFESKWGTTVSQLDDAGRLQLRNSDGSIVMTRYPSTNTDYFGIDINYVNEDRILKIRAGH